MSQRLLVAGLGAAALLGGIALVVAADRLGWLGSPDPQTPAEVPAAGIDWVELAETAAEPPPGPTPDPDTLRWKRPPSTDCAKMLTIVRLESPEVARAAGLRFEPVVTRSVPETISCNAVLAFDGDRFAHLAPRASGVIAEVHKGLGDRVEPGDVLATLDSVALGSAKAEYLAARALVALWEKNHARELALFQKQVGTEREMQEAEMKLTESRIAAAGAAQKLRNLGLSDAAIAQVAQRGDTSSRLEMAAPFAGTVVERDAVAGEIAETTRPLFAIADTSRMWAWLDLYEDDVERARPGQRVSIEVEGLRGREFTGTVDWVSAHVDPRTRTLKVRASLENPQGVLRANMFGYGEITVRERPEAVVVPKSAVQWEGCCNVVFVRHTDTVYQPYKVTLGDERDGHYVVEKGLPVGETIVTDGAFLLKTEILKGNIGAGCCEVDPGASRDAG
jgi:cobalt-zinc-cadmium efflux system membrane fusion protein